MFGILVAAVLPMMLLAQPERRILAVTASSGDYILGAGGTLAGYIRDGWRVDVAQFGNDEKTSNGLGPAQTRLANVSEGKAAAKLLGASDVVMMDHKSGEFAQVSSTEMRNQLFALIRGLKPRILFIPDPYVHYQPDHDQVLAGRKAEEAWGYSGAGTFANEMARMGLAPYGAPEVFYYSALRPYRAGEGGETERARFVARDISETLEQKITAALLLHTRNRAWISFYRGLLDDGGIERHMRAWVTELAQTTGSKHGLPYAEEFNHFGIVDSIPPYALEKARPRR